MKHPVRLLILLISRRRRHSKALPLSEQLENKAKYISIPGNTGSMHRMLDNPDKARYYFEQMKDLAEQTDNIFHQRKAYCELGTPAWTGRNMPNRRNICSSPLH
ncbi:MAG: hypothetical protein LBP25_01505 [Tannerellaceae bacterium]|jgi:hypothetical protein|nr:hypothetical protein [Tannerellaceae bacterium]